MRILGINFGAKPTVQTVLGSPQAVTTGFKFSTPFLKIGKGNLALPFISSFARSNTIIYFGEENLFPEILNQMYYTSPIHGACVDFTVKAALGGGFSVEGIETGKQKVAFEVFNRRFKLNKSLKKIGRDYKLHGRVHILMTFSESGKWLKACRLDPSTIRYRHDGDYEYSADWSTSRDRRIIKRYRPDCVEGEMLYTYGEPGAGQDYYPIPSYSSALNWCFLDGEQSLLHKSNIQNSIFPSLVIRRPKRFSNKKEIDDFTDGINANKGAENTGKVILLTGDGIENTPEVVQVNANNNDKLFDTTARELKDNICFAHSINPSIMGIKVAGSLGNAQELETSYAIFEKNVVKPFRQDMEELLSELMQICEVEGTITINEYTLYLEQDAEVVSSVGDKLNKMSPLLANKVLENLTINEIRNIAGLPPVADGDKMNSAATQTPPIQ